MLGICLIQLRLVLSHFIRGSLINEASSGNGVGGLIVDCFSDGIMLETGVEQPQLIGALHESQDRCQ